MANEQNVQNYKEQADLPIPAYDPNKSLTENISNQPATGSGIESAIGTEYSWNKQGAEQANTQYQIDVLNAKQQALENRRTIEENSKNYQTDSDMMQYKYNQEAEKVGWTGGYVLDQNRQMDYLKAGIQAQLYGAMELQRYGYDTSLAAARLSYDLNQKEYARKYYESAVNIALQEYPVIGAYISAENRDMLSQSHVAEATIESIKEEYPDAFDEEGNLKPDANLGERTSEYQRAQTVSNNIDKWYAENGISKQGRLTYEAMYNELTTRLQETQQEWEKYWTIAKDFNDRYGNSGNIYMKYDENGNPIMNDYDVEKIDFSTESASNAIDYASSGSIPKSQLYGYFNSEITKAVTEYINSNTTKDNDGNITSDKTSAEGLQDAIKKVFETGALKDYKDFENNDLLKNYIYNNNEQTGYTISGYKFGTSDSFVTKKNSTLASSVTSISDKTITDSSNWEISSSYNNASGKLRFDFSDGKGGTEDVAVKVVTCGLGNGKTAGTSVDTIAYDALGLEKGSKFGTKEFESMSENEVKLIKNNDKYVIVQKLPNDYYAIAFSGTVKGLTYNTTDKWKTGFKKIVNTLQTNSNYLLDISNW